MQATTTSLRETTRRIDPRWRVVDIVVSSVLGVASAPVFFAWNQVYAPVTAPLESLQPGSQALLYGIWLFAGVLGGLVIRKPGAALFTELVAAIVSAFLGAQWGGFATIEAGLVQGLGAELIFLVFLYHRWNVMVAMLAGAAAGLAMAVNDIVGYYLASGPAFQAVYTVLSIISGAVVAALGSWFIVRGLRPHRRPQSLRVRPTLGSLSSIVTSVLSRAAPLSVDAQAWGWRHAGRSDWAVRELDLRTEPGERVLLLGSSGAGKSTLVHALAQGLRLPSRFVLGALGGLRIVGLFAEDGKSLELARCARGIGDSGRLRRFAGQAFALLVLSIRRGSKLATAMEARGFGSSIPRSWARESRFGGREWMLVALSFAIALAAVGTSVLTGHWNSLAGA